MTAKRTATNDSHLCLFSFSDGRQCRMLRLKDHATLCIFHARDERQLIEADKLGREIAAPPSGEYLTAVDVNHVLGKLFAAVAQNRLPTRNAAILAYLGQLLLQSVPKVQDEIINAEDTDFWRDPVAVVKTPCHFVLPRCLPPLPVSVPSALSVLRTLRLFVRPNLSGR